MLGYQNINAFQVILRNHVQIQRSLEKDDMERRTEKDVEY